MLRGVHTPAIALAVAIAACAACSAEDAPMPPGDRGIITTAAGTGLSSFGGDGRPAIESPLYAPVKVGFSVTGRAEIIDWNNHRVREVQSNDTLLTVLGTGNESYGPANVLSIAFAIHHPFDLEQKNGEMYYPGFHDPRVFKVDRDQRVRIVAGFGTVGNAGDGGPAQLALLNEPSGVAVADDGTVYFSDSKNHVIRKVDGNEVIDHVAGSSAPGYDGDGGPARTASLRGPTRLELDSDGNLLFCDTQNHAVRKIDTAGMIHTIAGTGQPGYDGDGGPATRAQLNEPIDLILLRDGGLLIADSQNHAVRHVDAEGLIRTVVGTSTSGFAGDGGLAREATLNTPHGITLDAQGRLWIADTSNHRVRVVTTGFLIR